MFVIINVNISYHLMQVQIAMPINPLLSTGVIMATSESEFSLDQDHRLTSVAQTRRTKSVREACMHCMVLKSQSNYWCQKN